MQLSFGEAEYAGKRKQTRREKFLLEMERTIPWDCLAKRIETHYPQQGKRGRPPYRLETMLRIHFMQQWFNLSDPAMEEALYDIALMRQFAGLSLTQGSIPDETTILNFRHLLEAHGIAEELFEGVRLFLQDQGLFVRQGTMVDATIIDAPSSTKNASGERDPEMHQTKKGNQWRFGMKAHIGVDLHTGLVHSVHGTSANEADVTHAHHLLHGDEQLVLGDGGYQGVEAREENQARHVQWFIAEKPSKVNFDQQPYVNTYTYTLGRFEGYVETSLSGTSNVYQPGTTTYGYDANGNLTSVTDQQNGANNQTLVNDVNGKILQRTQNGTTVRSLVVNGELMGTTGPAAGEADFTPTYRPIDGSNRISQSQDFGRDAGAAAIARDCWRTSPTL